MLLKETKKRMQRLEKTHQPSGDEKLKQEFVADYKAQNKLISERIEETDDKQKVKIYQAVLSNREKILSNALGNPKVMNGMLQSYLYSKTPEAQNKQLEMRERLEKRKYGSG